MGVIFLVEKGSTATELGCEKRCFWLFEEILSVLREMYRFIEEAGSHARVLVMVCLATRTATIYIYDTFCKHFPVRKGQQRCQSIFY